MGTARASQEAVCPDDAAAVIRELLTADTLGVGLSAASRDSSQIDTLVTERFAEAPDMTYVITAFKLSCLFSARDSVIMRVETWHAGTIQWDDTGPRYLKVFIPEPRTTFGYATLVRRATGWKLLGPYAAISVSPGTALARFTNLTDESRRGLKRLIRRRSTAPRRGQ